jgi:MFS superfamily sulfate permease-like transporter
MAVSIAFLGGRPAMISAATGAVALVVAPVMRDHGYDYLIATVLLGGLIQVALALAGVARLMRFIPRSVMVGFVNALAILIFTSQVPYLIGVPWLVYPMVAVGLLIMFFLPKLTTVVPAPLIAIVILTAVTLVFALAVPDVGDEGELPSSLPSFLIPDVPFTFDTLSIIAPFALAIALVGGSSVVSVRPARPIRGLPCGRGGRLGVLARGAAARSGRGADRNRSRAAGGGGKRRHAPRRRDAPATTPVAAFRLGHSQAPSALLGCRITP